MKDKEWEALKDKAIREFSKGQFKEAYEDLKSAYNLNPKVAHMPYFLGKMAENVNKEEARGWYKKAISNNEDVDESKDRLEDLEEETKYNLEFIESDKTFDDLIGMDAIKKQLTERIIHAVQYPELFAKHKKRVGLGIVFYGAPGCGKTFLARCLAGEAQKRSNRAIKVAVIRISKILDMYVGNSEKNVANIFAQARKNAPCIMFFDEFDALGRTRSSNSDQASDSSTMSKVVDELLAEMDGIEKKADGIFVIAATNRPWEIDESLKRSGRFSNTVYVRPPNYKERVELFKLYLKGHPQERLNWGRLARATDSFSQADIADLCDDIAIVPIEKEITQLEKGNKATKEPKLTTSTLLYSIFHKKSTIVPWYVSMKKELVGIPKTTIRDGKKYTDYVQGKLNAQEKKQYQQLIDDIKLNCSVETEIGRAFTRNTALFLA